MFQAKNIHYDLSKRTKGIDSGGIGAIHKLVQKFKLPDEINNHLRLLKFHLPYLESDHVLNIAYNIISGGTCLEHLEILRNNEVYLNALDAQRIPDPTTAGDFCRRFAVEDIESLMEAINKVRARIWKKQPDSFFSKAIIEADGTFVETTGECKEGMDISYNGKWGYHPLLVSLANTNEPLFIANRSGNRPSHEGAAQRFDQSIDLCKKVGFKKICLRGDTDFTQTEHLDRWDENNVEFIFGIDAMKNLVLKAQSLPGDAWEKLDRPKKYNVKTESRTKPRNLKSKIVFERKFTDIRLNAECVSEFSYSPSKCRKTYRVVVLRKNLTKVKGEQTLIDEIRYFFYITNNTKSSKEKVVFSANKRCNQENLIQQLKNGAHALHAPVDNLESNWAYMVMASLAWSLKSWFALSLPENGRWEKKYKTEKKTVLKMEFNTFLNAFIRIPAQIIRQGRKIIYKFLSWNPWMHVFFRVVDQLHGKMKC